MTTIQRYLEETPFFDYSHPAVVSWIERLEGQSVLQKLLHAYYLVRDEIPYNPYTFSQGKGALKASFAASSDSAYCIPKSALLIAISRSLGIPARIGLADVRNHLSSPKLLNWLGTDVFVMHGYAELYLHHKWVKCTPVFNQSLCEKFGIHALDFDGLHDSVFQPFTESGQAHMEYVSEHGSFDDVPAEKIFSAVAQAYPHLDMFNAPADGQRLELEIN